MKTRSSFYFLGLLAAASMGLGTRSSATTAGLTPDTAGSYGIWDTFAANTFTNRGPDASAAIGTPLLNVSSSGLVLGGGDRLYLAGAASTWSASGTTGFAVKSFTLQLKNYTYTTQSLNTYFMASLDLGGITYAPDSAVVTTVPENGFTDEILTWTWRAALAANTGTTFNVRFASTSGANISIDGFDVSAAPTAVAPEPSSIAGAVVGGVAMLGAVKRLRSRKAA